MAVPTLPNEVNSSIQHLMRRGVKNTRSSRLRKLIERQAKQQKMLDLILPNKRKQPWN